MLYKVYNNYVCMCVCVGVRACIRTYVCTVYACFSISVFSNREMLAQCKYKWLGG